MTHRLLQKQQGGGDDECRDNGLSEPAAQAIVVACAETLGGDARRAHAQEIEADEEKAEENPETERPADLEEGGEDRA